MKQQKKYISFVALFSLTATMLVGLICPMNGLSMANHADHSNCTGSRLVLTAANSDCHGSHFGVLENFIGTMPDLSFGMLVSAFLAILTFGVVVSLSLSNINFLVKWRHLYLKYLDKIRISFRKSFECWLNLTVKPVVAN